MYKFTLNVFSKIEKLCIRFTLGGCYQDFAVVKLIFDIIVYFAMKYFFDFR